MRSRFLLTCVAFLALSTVSLAQYQEFYYNETLEGLDFSGAPAGLEDPSFEYPFSARPSKDKIFVSKDFETNDFNAVQSLTRSWIGTPDEERVLGRKFLRINGTGCVANWFPITTLFDTSSSAGPSLGHYVTVRAKQDGPFEAIFGINYFDSNWKLIQKNSALISGAEAGTSRGDGDLLKKYTIPVHVPYGAAFGQVWIAAPYANGTTTFDFLSVFTEARSAENDWFNPTANLLRNSSRFLGDFDYYKTGYEFWNAIPGSEAGARVDNWKLGFGKGLLLGQPGRITNLYQVFDIQPNQPFSLTLLTSTRPGLLAANPLPHARAWFGVDFFDSSAKKIDQAVFDITDGVTIDLYTMHAPVPNADFAIAWFYVEPLFRDEVLPIFSLSIHVPYPVATTTPVAKTSSVATTKSIGTKSKSTKRPPASPITPAIALQAKNSLPVAAPKAATSKPTAK